MSRPGGDVKSAAVITVKKPGAMTLRGRKSIAAWLRQQARYLERKRGMIFTEKGNFTARYIYL